MSESESESGSGSWSSQYGFLQRTSSNGNGGGRGSEFTLLTCGSGMIRSELSIHPGKKSTSCKELVRAVSNSRRVLDSDIFLW